MSPSAREVFPRNLQKLMDAKGMKQKDLALALGVTPTAINDWVKGKKYPRVDKIESITRLFGITQADLVKEHKPISLRSPVEVGNIIRERREKLGLSHEQLAVKANTSVASLRRWEKGKVANPRTDAIENLAKALDLPSAILRGIPLTEPQIQRQRFRERLYKEIPNLVLSDEEIAQVINYIKFVISQRK